MANKTYRLANQALDDLNSIAETIAADRPSAATRVLDRLLNAFELLAENPGIGVSRNDLRNGVHMFVPRPPAENYIIFYYPIENGIEVSDVIHGKRDWTGMFFRKER